VQCIKTAYTALHVFFFFFSQIEAILGGEDVEAMMAGSDLPNDPEVLQMVIESSQAEVANLQANIAEEDRKMERYRVRYSMFKILKNCLTWSLI